MKLFFILGNQLFPLKNLDRFKKDHLFGIGKAGPDISGIVLSNTLGINVCTFPMISVITFALNCSDVTYLYAKYVPPLMEATIRKETMLRILAIF